MSTHPNVILMLVLKPDDLARKTYRALIDRFGDGSALGDRVEVGGRDYNLLVMEDNYDEGIQIAADEGDVVLYDFVTYGYGESIAWDELAGRAAELRGWADEISGEFNIGSFEIRVSANYW